MQTLEEVLNKYKPQVKQAIEKWIPRVISDEYILSVSGSPSFSHNAASLTQAVSVPVYDMLDRGTLTSIVSMFYLILH
jgi:hypothetical protein